MIVVDASVAVKWLLPEHGSHEAQQLLEGHDVLVAPTLIRLEVAGAIIRHFRNGSLTAEQARTLCGNWQEMLGDGVIGMLSTDKIFGRAIEMSILARYALADCLYLAAAEGFGAPVITADKAMHERGLRAYPNIQPLIPAV